MPILVTPFTAGPLEDSQCDLTFRAKSRPIFAQMAQRPLTLRATSETLLIRRILAKKGKQNDQISVKKAAQLVRNQPFWSH